MNQLLKQLQGSGFNGYFFRDISLGIENIKLG